MSFNFTTPTENKMLIIPKKNLGLNGGISADFTRGHKAIVSRNAFKLENATLLTAGNSLSDDALEGDTYDDYEGCPSKFLLMCLNTIQNDLQHDEAMINEKSTPFFALPWGFEFWKYYSIGKDILDPRQSHSTIEQIAWIASTASDAVSRREDEGLSMSSPFLLYLVPSQQEAVKVHGVCKPLEAVGIHTICLHPNASIKQQINGIRECEPEFVISTPDRLAELIALNAIDLSGVSLLVIDGVDYEDRSVEAIETIRGSVPSSSQTMIFGGSI